MAQNEDGQLRTKYHVGLSHVGSYQVSGKPFLTGAYLIAGDEKKFEFPYVTKKFTVTLSGAFAGTDRSEKNQVRIHFAKAGGNYNPGVVGNPATIGGDNSFHYAYLDGNEDSQTF